jgi:hypothetical protein
MIIGNGSIYNKSPMVQCGGAAFLNTYIQNRQNVVRWMATTFGKLHSRPQGSESQYAWILSQKGGDIASRNEITGAGSVASNLKLNGEIAAAISACLGSISAAALTQGGGIAVNITGSGTVTNPSLNILAWALANLAGAGGITTAELLTPFLLAADLAGAGSISEAAMTGVVKLLVDLSGAGELTDPDLKAYAQLVASISGAGDMEGLIQGISWLVASILAEGDVEGDVKSKMFMQASIQATGDVLTAQSVAAAVWESLAAVYNTAGSMGEKVNDAGSASNPWTEIIESGYTAAEILRIVTAAIAGKVSGAEGTNPKFRDLADTKDRIDATTDQYGNRTAVTLDAD